MPNMTGRPGHWTMEMNGGSSALYLACAPCVPLLVHCLLRVEAEGLLDYQGRAEIISIVRWNLRPVIFGVHFWGPRHFCARQFQSMKIGGSDRCTGFIKLKWSHTGIPREQADLRKSKLRRKLLEKWTLPLPFQMRPVRSLISTSTSTSTSISCKSLSENPSTPKIHVRTLPKTPLANPLSKSF